MLHYRLGYLGQHQQEMERMKFNVKTHMARGRKDNIRNVKNVKIFYVVVQNIRQEWLLIILDEELSKDISLTTRSRLFGTLKIVFCNLDKPK